MSRIYTTHSNILSKKSIKGIPRSNLIQAIVFTSIVVFILRKIPFLPVPKNILSISIGMFTFIVFCIGIKRRSVIQFIRDYVENKRGTNILHLRSIKDAKATKLGKDGEIEQLTIAQQFIISFKEKRNKNKKK